MWLKKKLIKIIFIDQYSKYHASTAFLGEYLSLPTTLIYNIQLCTKQCNHIHKQFTHA